MNTKLKHYFPLIWERNELITKINETKALSTLFDCWDKLQQEEFLDFCTGIRGVKILYDSFFKEIMNPEYTPQRLNDFLSCILGKKVKIKAVLPNDSTRLADETSLLSTDIVIELEDGTLANLEVQKIGYKFPAERSACYSSDLLLRQYKRVRDEKKKSFSYKDIQNVYVIVLFENSPPEFARFPQYFIHTAEQVTNTGIPLNLLQKYVFLSLDIFKKRPHNELINSKLEAWLTFLSTDDPKSIIQLIESYPEFRQMYSQVYEMCRNLEDIMGLFSKELSMMDRNTVQLMIDEMQEELTQSHKAVEDLQKTLETKDSLLTEKDSLLTEKEHELEELRRQLAAFQADNPA